MNIENKIEQEKELIFRRMLQNAAFDGWNEETLQKSTDEVTNGTCCRFYFDNGIHDFTLYMNERTNRLMREEFLKKFDPASMKVRDRIRELIWIRLNILAERKDAVRALYGFLAMPQNLLFFKKLIWQISDEIWHLALDESTDFNYYSKRGLLSIIYNASINYWLNDESKNHQKTYDFIIRAIDGVMQINKVKSCFKKVPEIIKKIPFLRLCFK